MKKLTKIRLVNWYHIQDETLPISGSALFMGDNGSGKSTILDAIQFALVADLSQVKFNQAANEQAARTLQGYTRWMTNSTGTKESHQYNRGDCTSFVLLEFSEGSDETVFTVGAVVDSFKDGRDPNRLHFIANQTPISAVPVYREGTRVPLTTALFRQLMATRKGFFYARDPGPFRDNLLTRLGQLSPDFAKILVKAQAFKPLGQVHQFVMDFLLDARPLDTQNLQANLGQYKALEQKAIEAEKRILHLDRIAEKHLELRRVGEEILSFRYLEIRGSAGIQESLIERSSQELESAARTQSESQVKIADLRKLSETCESEIGSVWKSLNEHSGYLERERLKDELSRKKSEFAEVQNAISNSRTDEKRLAKVQGELTKICAYFPGLLAAPTVSATPEQYTELLYQVRRTHDSSQVELAKLKNTGLELDGKLEELKKGVRPYTKESKALKELIQDQLGCEAPLLCELLEIRDEKWQAAVEGYLNTRRFDIVLDPKYFRKALTLYEKNKRQLNLHGVGLVDAEKVSQAKFSARENSLAEIVTSQNAWAKAYADFVLGDVIRCESETELRKHSKAITPSCMVYQNYAARQTPFHVFEAWHIGSRGHAQLLENTEKERTGLFETFKQAAEQIGRLDEALRLCTEAEKCARNAAILAQLIEKEIRLSIEIVRAEELLKQISTGEVELLEKRIELLRSERDGLTAKTEELLQLLGATSQRIETLRDAIGAATRQRDLHFAELAIQFASPELQLKLPALAEKYAVELDRRKAPQEICRVYESQRKNRETQRFNIIESLAALRTEYNNLFGFSGPAQGDDVTPYLAELTSWKDSLLPDYRQKIEKAKDSALQQLMEDIVHKLRENLDLIPSQFDQINRALRGFDFGADQYQFTYRVKKEFEPFERLIREAALYETQPLFETNWKERFKDGGALEGLFLDLVSGSSARVQEDLKQYSDYRQYYDYDLKILHRDGTYSFYSQVNRWKSGGETQTPYYIAVLASLYRLYRLQPEKTGKQRAGTIGLVVLDEAFNKMDEDHLRATLQFTRKLGLQLIMATPKERAEFIIPHIESCWIVAKDEQSGQAFLLDYHQDLDQISKVAPDKVVDKVVDKINENEEILPATQNARALAGADLHPA